jgi:Apea-like HEPN
MAFNLNERDVEELRERSSTFLHSAFSSLLREGTLPGSRHHPFMRVGRDYYGGSVMPLDEFVALEDSLRRTCPDRFKPAGPLTEYPQQYIFALLEGAIARCTIAGVECDFASEHCVATVDELLSRLQVESPQVTCAAEVSHLTTSDGHALNFESFDVIPESRGMRGGMFRSAAKLIPGLQGARDRGRTMESAPPAALVVAARSGLGGGSEPQIDDARRDIARFILLTRLIHASTCTLEWEGCGESTLVAYRQPTLHFNSHPSTLVKRTGFLTPRDVPAFKNVDSVLHPLATPGPDWLGTSFSLAINRFQRSFRAETPFDAIVDLTTALEAVLISDDKDSDAVSLRLRTRASSLLDTEEDPPRAIFDDLTILYETRSQLVHGGNIKDQKLRARIGKLSSIESETPFDIAMALAADRLSDIVRRAMLARMYLASESVMLWPLSRGVAVDAILSDPAMRYLWREAWRDELANAGCPGAAERARPAAGQFEVESAPED